MGGVASSEWWVTEARRDTGDWKKQWVSSFQQSWSSATYSAICITFLFSVLVQFREQSDIKFGQKKK